jgi:hypothetical protein
MPKNKNDFNPNKVKRTAYLINYLINRNCVKSLRAMSEEIGQTVGKLSTTTLSRWSREQAHPQDDNLGILAAFLRTEKQTLLEFVSQPGIPKEKEMRSLLENFHEYRLSASSSTTQQRLGINGIFSAIAEIDAIQDVVAVIHEALDRIKSLSLKHFPPIPVEGKSKEPHMIAHKIVDWASKQGMDVGAVEVMIAEMGIPHKKVEDILEGKVHPTQEELALIGMVLTDEDGEPLSPEELFAKCEHEPANH